MFDGDHPPGLLVREPFFDRGHFAAVVVKMVERGANDGSLVSEFTAGDERFDLARQISG